MPGLDGLPGAELELEPDPPREASAAKPKASPKAAPAKPNAPQPGTPAGAATGVPSSGVVPPAAPKPAGAP